MYVFEIGVAPVDEEEGVAEFQDPGVLDLTSVPLPVLLYLLLMGGWLAWLFIRLRKAEESHSASTPAIQPDHFSA